jgi:putative phosphoribosyl transferase
MMNRPFKDRHHAGEVLAERLRQYADRPDVLVLALPRGGVPVGFEISRLLRVPLDVFVVRKIGAPFYEELAVGAIASGGVRVLNELLIKRLGISQEAIQAITQEEGQELARREQLYRGARPPLHVEDKTVLLVDDGLATGASMRAAVRALRHHRPRRILVAVPVGAPETCRELEQEADEVVCAEKPEDLGAVGMWYEDFSQTTDEEVSVLLHLAPHGSPSASGGLDGGIGRLAGPR